MSVSRVPSPPAPPPVPGSALTPWQALPACTDACRSYRVLFLGSRMPCETLIHDPAAHEAWGRYLMGERIKGTVRTGPLVIDLDRCCVTNEGRPLSLTFRETQIILILAHRADYVVPYYDFLQSIWGPEYVPEARTLNQQMLSEIHLIRVHVARLRKKLRAAAPLVQTQVGVGIRLLLVAPTEEA